MSAILRTLGLCRKARALVCGAPMICSALPSGTVRVVFEACDTSDGTHKKLTDKCAYYRVRHERLSVGGEELASAVGKSGFLAAVAINDENLARLSEKSLNEDKS